MNDAPDEPPDRHRVFFALWPDDATRAAISRATREAVRLSGGRPIAKERLHVTVAFLGELTAAGLEAARAVPPIPSRPADRGARAGYRASHRHGDA